MENVKIKFLPLHEEVQVPQYQTEHASGRDIHAFIPFDKSEKDFYQKSFILVCPGIPSKIPTGFCLGIPEGYEIQIRPRSGLSAKYGVTAIFGTIDSDYRGQIHVIMENITDMPYKVHHGDRIAQMVLQEVPRTKLMTVDSLDETDRGDGGFGHTGK